MSERAWFLEKPYRTVEQECIRRGLIPDPDGATARQERFARVVDEQQPVPLLHAALGYHDFSGGVDESGYWHPAFDPKWGDAEVTIDREREGDWIEVHDGAGRLIYRRRVT